MKNLFIASVMFLAACGSTNTVIADGTTGGKCYANSTCNTGLTCASNLCVDLNATPDTGTVTTSDSQTSDSQATVTTTVVADSGTPDSQATTTVTADSQVTTTAAPDSQVQDTAVVVPDVNVTSYFTAGNLGSCTNTKIDTLSMTPYVIYYNQANASVCYDSKQYPTNPKIGFAQYIQATCQYMIADTSANAGFEKKLYQTVDPTTYATQWANSVIDGKQYSGAQVVCEKFNLEAFAQGALSAITTCSRWAFELTCRSSGCPDLTKVQVLLNSYSADCMTKLYANSPSIPQ